MPEAKIKDREWIAQGSFSREILEESLLEVFKKKFEELTPICVDRVVAANGDATCVYHESSATDCRFSICPRLDLPLHKAAIHLEKTEERRY